MLDRLERAWSGVTAPGWLVTLIALINAASTAEYIAGKMQTVWNVISGNWGFVIGLTWIALVVVWPDLKRAFTGKERKRLQKTFEELTFPEQIAVRLVYRQPHGRPLHSVDLQRKLKQLGMPVDDGAAFRHAIVGSGLVEGQWMGDLYPHHAAEHHIRKLLRETRVL